MSNPINPDFLAPLNKGIYMNLTVPQKVPFVFIPCHPHGIFYWQNGTVYFSGTQLRFSSVNIISPILNIK